MAVSLDKEYIIGDGEVLLTVFIDEGQFGTSKVDVDGTEIKRGDIQKLKIGTKGNLTEMKVKTIVTDVNDKTNKMNVIYTINDEAHSDTFSLKSSVQEEGDSEVFKLNIKFS